MPLISHAIHVCLLNLLNFVSSFNKLYTFKIDLNQFDRRNWNDLSLCFVIAQRVLTHKSGWVVHSFCPFVLLMFISRPNSTQHNIGILYCIFLGRLCIWTKLCVIDYFPGRHRDHLNGMDSLDEFQLFENMLQKVRINNKLCLCLFCFLSGCRRTIEEGENVGQACQLINCK